jgi:predicted nucleic acid-binding protein
MAEIVLDSDVIIWHLRGRADVVKKVAAWSSTRRLGISAVTRTEVLVGARQREEEATRAFLDAFEIIPVNAAVADRAARLIKDERRRGHTADVPDALIAACAMDRQARLVTCNVKHFPFEGLEVGEP